MKPNPFASIALAGERGLPDGPGPYVFLLEISGSLEESLLEGWIERHTRGTDPAGVHRAYLPQTRRRPDTNRPDPRLEESLGLADDPLVVPLRIAWLPPKRHGERVVRWRDLIRFGDPRDPDPIRQHIIFRTRPDRCRIVMGEPSRLSVLRAAHSDPTERRAHDGVSLTDFVATRAWLALERAERELRGNQYKVPRFPREFMTATTAFTNGVARMAAEAGTSYEVMAARTRRYVGEIAATHSPYVIDLVAGAFSWIIEKAYVELKYDRDELAALYQMGQRFPLVFLPSHKSNFDHLVLMYALYRNGLPPNHTAGGHNMNFFPVGPFLRRSGIFFIRREFGDNDPYKFVLRRYIDYLLERRFPLEWYIEGGRSRTGKLREPRFGLLAYLVESFERGSADDVIIMPVSIAYDQIHEVRSYAREQSGGAKQRESFTWLVNNLGSLRRRYGSAHLRFGAPISLKGFLAQHDAPPVEAEDLRNPAVPRLAFEVAARINEVTPITPISLVTLALLTAGGRALTLDEVEAALEPFTDYVARRDLPVTEKLDASDRGAIAAALADLERHHVVTRFVGATDIVYRIEADQQLAAAYYRNTIIHFFVNGAITEVALQRAARKGATTVAAVIAEAAALRDLLKFEFFFEAREDFEENIAGEMRYRDEGWRDLVLTGKLDSLLGRFQPLHSPAILRPFIDAYAVVAAVIERRAYDSVIDAESVAAEALSLGKQWLLQGRLHSGESVSDLLFRSAIALARNRGVFDTGPDIVETRLSFARDVQQVRADLVTLQSVEQAREAGVLD